MGTFFNEYQERIKPTEFWPKTMGPSYPIIGLSSEVGEVANEIKKMYRDDCGNLTPERKQKIIEEMGDVLWYLASLASSLHLELENIVQVSLNKVENRTWEKNQ